MSQPSSILVSYGEIGLKGSNRRDFETLLIRNIRSALQRFSQVRVERWRGRIVLTPDEDASATAGRIRNVFGIASVYPCIRVPQQWDRMQSAAIALTDGFLQACPGDRPVPFRVTARRADKDFPKNSEEVNRDLGAALLCAFPRLKVRLDDPVLELGVELRQGEAFLYSEKIPGPGGLPVGSVGRVALLISGGIDSPVAAYLCMKRGCEVVFVHFHSQPYTGEMSREKTLDLVRRLAHFQHRTLAIMVPFARIQRAIRKDTPEKYRTVLYRRMMQRIAARIARDQDAPAVATGDNLGQVASQTLENMAVIDAASEVPVLRPLLTYEKNEIVAIARRIGTYETSIRPYPDCCTLFQPARPVIHGKVDEARRAEERLAVEQLVEDAMGNLESITISASA